MWVEFVGSLFYSYRFFSGCCFNPWLLIVYIMLLLVTSDYWSAFDGQFGSNRPNRLTQCCTSCTQFKSPEIMSFCVLYLRDNVAFIFTWYGNIWNKTSYSQRVWIGYNIRSMRGLRETGITRRQLELGTSISIIVTRSFPMKMTPGLLLDLAWHSHFCGARKWSGIFYHTSVLVFLVITL